MATKWYDDPRLPADVRKRAADANQQMQQRQRDLDAQQAAEQAERDRLNAEARKRYLGELDAKKAAAQARRDAEEEQRLAPVKRKEMLQWMIDHPGTTEADFENVWPHIKELRGIGSREAAIQRTIEAARRRGY